jgi:diketogulonate reductase-like aldo/keto reductase
MKKEECISVKEAMDELLETSIFKKVAERNNKDFAQKLALWLIRYILIISSMNESLKINLELVLLRLHGENFRRILEITNRTFKAVQKDSEDYSKYIW